MRRAQQFARALLLVGGTFSGLQGCGDSSGDPTRPSLPPPPPPPTNGSVVVTVLNELGAGVSGANVTLTRAGGGATRDTDSNGVATFANAPAGSWQANVTPPAGHQLDPDFTLPVAVTVVAGETTNVTLRIRTTP